MRYIIEIFTMKKLKDIPKFDSEDEEREFWSKADSTDYIYWHKSQMVVFPDLKPTTKSIKNKKGNKT